MENIRNQLALIARDGEITWTKTEVCIVMMEFRYILYIYTFRRKLFIKKLNLILSRLNLKEMNSKQAKENDVLLMYGYE